MRKVWEEVVNTEAFTKVFDRLKKNFSIIEKCEGSNDYVEQFRGKKGMEKLDEWELPEALRREEDEVGLDLEEGGEDEGGLVDAI